MTDPELDRLLRCADVPERPADYWQQFPRRVGHRLRQPDSTRPTVERPRAYSLVLWGVGLATTCLVAAFVLVQRGAQSAPAVLPLGAGRQLVQELATLFPHQLQALVMDREGVHVVLSNHPDVAAGPPVIVSLCQDGRRRTIITFSGQQVQAGRQTFEVLTDGHNNVLLIGDHSVWSSRDPARPIDGLKAEARLLEGVQ